MESSSGLYLCHLGIVSREASSSKTVFVVTFVFVFFKKKIAVHYAIWANELVLKSTPCDNITWAKFWIDLPYLP